MRWEGVLPPELFRRLDESSDAGFYAVPRLVTHIDDATIAALTAFYRERIPAGAHVLDLMSSWISHLRTPPASLTVLGMNQHELERNPLATAFVVHDLNAEPHLPFADATFDAVTCCVSVDYLVRPVEVFADVARVLRPSAPFVCTFSNRCFPTKAIRGWLMSTDLQRAAIVAAYFRLAGGWDEPIVQRRDRPGTGDPLYAVWAQRI